MHEQNSEAGYAALKAAILAKAPPRSRNDAFAPYPFAEAAVAVYRNNVRAAYYRVLRDTFPVVHKLVGDDFFRGMAHDYFHNKLPVSRLVSIYGYALPAFIETYPPCATLPYLADVARFEILWLQSYHATEAASLSVEAIERRLASAPETAHVRLHPSTRLFASRFPVIDIWRNNRRDNPEPMTIKRSADFALIARPAHDVRVEKLTGGAFQVLEALTAGKSLGEAFDGEFDATENPTTIFQQIFAAEIITEITNA